MKTEYLRILDNLILAAPQDPPSVARSRARKPRSFKGEDRARFRQDEKQRIAEEIGDNCRGEGIAKIVFVAGPTTYTLWNTKENLTAFRSRFARIYR